MHHKIWLFALLLGGLQIYDKSCFAAKSDQVLNFEDELIEGERRHPDIFMQTEVKGISMDSVDYMRKNFNDYQKFEMNKRPSHFGKQRASP